MDVLTFDDPIMTTLIRSTPGCTDVRCPFCFKRMRPDYKESFPPQDAQFKDDWLARTCELVDRFHPDLMWFDFGITASEKLNYSDNHYSPYLQRFAAYYYNVSKKSNGDIGIINYKWKAFPEKAAVLDLERSKMDAIRHNRFGKPTRR